MSTSSSPQISRRDGASNSLQSFSKISASSASASASTSASASASADASAYNSAYKLPAQEETVFQKETVRISPPSHQKQIPVSTYYANGHLKNSRYLFTYIWTSLVWSPVVNRKQFLPRLVRQKYSPFGKF